MPAYIPVTEKVLQFTKTRQTKKAQSQAQAQQQSKHINSPFSKSNGLNLLPVLAQPNGDPGRFREEFEPEPLLKEKEKSLDLFPFLLEVSPQGKENETPARVGSFPSHRQFSPLPSKHERCRQRLEAGLEIRFFSRESSNSAMDSLLTFVMDCQKPLPALPRPDFEKPLPPIPEIEEEFTFFFDTICRNCGVEEGNTQKGWSGQDFEMWVDTEDCGYCRDGDEGGEVGVAGVNIREADIIW
jgi:hypothetical protein